MNPQATEAEKTLKAKRWFLTVWTIVGAISLTGVVVYLMGILSLPVSIVLWTLIIVFCLRGTVNALHARGMNRMLATGVAYVLMAAVLALAGLLLFSPVFGLGDQFANLMQSVPIYLQSLFDWANHLYAENADVFNNEAVRQWLNDAQAGLLSWASDLAPSTAAGIVSVGSSIMNGLMAFGFALVIAFWILMELPDIGRECERLIGDNHREDFAMLHVTFTRIMGGYIKGTLLQCAIIGAACAVLFSVLGIPNAVALGGIAGLLNIIPVVGPWLGGALAAIVGIFLGPLVAAVALVGTIAVQQFVYTFVSPKIMQSSVDIHPALMLIALMCGSALGGAMNGLVGSLVGMLVVIPAVAVAKAVFVYYFEKRTGRQLVSADGVFFKGTPAEGEGVNPIADATSPHPDATASFKAVRMRRRESLRRQQEYVERHHGVRSKEEKSPDEPSKEE